MIIVVILLISVLECTVYIKERNRRNQKLLETTIQDIEKKETEIKIYKQELEEYKELNQKEEAQTTKIEQLETIIENSKYSINKENLTVPDDLDREEAKDNYEVTNAKKKVITDKNYKSYLGDIPSDYSRDISLKKGVEEVNGIDKALKIPDRGERIAYLKDIISKINTKDE
jgi:hypothetical protein